MKNKIFFIIFMVTWLCLVVFNFFVPKSKFSEQENRYLASVPEFNFDDLVDGEYAEGLDNYINDHFVARNFWLKLNSFMQIKTGKTENNDVYIGKDNYLFEKFNYRLEEKKNLEEIANSINKFSKKIDVPIYFMLVPNSIYIYKEKLPDNVDVYDQSKIIDEFYKKLNSSIKTIEVVNVLQENKQSNLYFKTDHHIKSIGAYLLYTEFCNTANLNSIPLSDFQKEVVTTNFLGTLDSKAQVFGQKADDIEVYLNENNQNVEVNYDDSVDTSIFNESYLNKKDKYSYFLNGNNAKVIVKTKVNNGRKLMVIKDSYAHIFAQFLCQNYEEIHFIDPRYYKASVSDYMKQKEIDEILFLYNVSNMVTDTSLKIIK